MVELGTANWQWLSGQFGAIREQIGELKAQHMGNRHLMIEVHRDLTSRMDRFEDKIERRIAKAGINGKPESRWHKAIIYLLSTRGLVFMALTVFLATGYITKDQFKEFLLRSLFLH